MGSLNSIDIAELIPIVAPLLVIQLILMIIAIVLCVKSEETRGPKIMWICIIIVGNMIGSIAFLIFGRRKDG